MCCEAISLPANESLCGLEDTLPFQFPIPELPLHQSSVAGSERRAAGRGSVGAPLVYPPHSGQPKLRIDLFQGQPRLTPRPSRRYLELSAAGPQPGQAPRALRRHTRRCT